MVLLCHARNVGSIATNFHSVSLRLKSMLDGDGIGGADEPYCEQQDSAMFSLGNATSGFTAGNAERVACSISDLALLNLRWLLCNISCWQPDLWSGWLCSIAWVNLDEVSLHSPLISWGSWSSKHTKMLSNTFCHLCIAVECLQMI